MEPLTIWQAYKAHSEWKDRLILFTVVTFYRTFESDAMFLSAVFNFQVNISNGAKTVGFPINS